MKLQGYFEFFPIVISKITLDLQIVAVLEDIGFILERHIPKSGNT